MGSAKEPESTAPKPDKALLIGAQLPGIDLEETTTLLDELKELVITLEIDIEYAALVRIKTISPKLLIGSGKAEELIELAKDKKCTTIIFDETLTPAQQRNWEKLSGLRVIDRQEVILDIFAKRAHTKEAVLQVELARLNYMLPRLTRAWTHLHRQRGGGGVTQRGEGEKQIELDQRMVRHRISRLKAELADVIKHRDVQRKKRMRVPMITGAIIGYTNAGKSSLLNKLTNAHILAEDKLFATLDPTTRKLELPSGQSILLTDTVGFIRKLPHHLVKAFRATLEEAIVADFLILVVDISDANAQQHLETTHQVLKDLNAQDKTILTIFNKIDLGRDPIATHALQKQTKEQLSISVHTGEGIQTLLDWIEDFLKKSSSYMELLIPHDRYDLLSQLHDAGAVKEKKAEAEGVMIRGNVPSRLKDLVAPFAR